MGDGFENVSHILIQLQRVKKLPPGGGKSGEEIVASVGGIAGQNYRPGAARAVRTRAMHARIGESKLPPGGGKSGETSNSVQAEPIVKTTARGRQER